MLRGAEILCMCSGGFEKSVRSRGKAKKLAIDRTKGLGPVA